MKIEDNPNDIIRCAKNRADATSAKALLSNIVSRGGCRRKVSNAIFAAMESISIIQHECDAVIERFVEEGGAE